MFLIWLYLSLLSYITYVHSNSLRQCKGTQACDGDTISCSGEQDCDIECSGNAACRNTKVTCPIGYACNIKCMIDTEIPLTDNENTCMNMQIFASDSTVLNVYAQFGDIVNEFTFPRTLIDAVIHCPHNGRQAGHKPCNIYCDGNDLMRRVQFYAVEGLNDLNINSVSYGEEDSRCMRATTLHCTEEFTESCALTNREPFECADFEHQLLPQICETYTIETNTPTAIPTQAPSVPSISPTPAPTNNPTQSPSMTPTAVTSSPSMAPTVNDAKEVAPPGNSGLNTTQLILVIILPLLAVFCICVGFGLYMIKKKSDSSHKHTSIDGDQEDDNDDDDDDDDDDDNDDDNDDDEDGYGDNRKMKTVSNYDSDESSSSSSHKVDIGMDKDKQSGHSGIYKDNNNNNSVQNGHKVTISDESPTDDDTPSEY